MSWLQNVSLKVHVVLGIFLLISKYTLAGGLPYNNIHIKLYDFVVKSIILELACVISSHTPA